MRFLAARQSYSIQHLKMASVTEEEFCMLAFHEKPKHSKQRKCGSDPPNELSILSWQKRCVIGP